MSISHLTYHNVCYQIFSDLEDSRDLGVAKSPSGAFPRQLQDHPRVSSGFVERNLLQVPPLDDVNEIDGIQDELEYKFDHQTVPITDPLWKDTDLVVFKGEKTYTGMLPLNGIRFLEFQKISRIFENIFINKTKLFFDQDNFEFNTFVIEQIKTILTRRIGQDLILQILKNPLIRKVEIRQASNNEDSAVDYLYLPYNDNDLNPDRFLTHAYKLQFNTLLNLDETTKLPNGKNARLKRIPYISLAHELMHIRHVDFDYTHPTFGIKFQRQEEQTTITGLRKSIPILPQSQLDHVSYDDSFFEDFEVGNETHPFYDDINENGLRASFNILPRIHWLGVQSRPANIVIEAEAVSQELGEYFLNAVCSELISEVEDFIKANPDINFKTYELHNKKLPILDWALYHAIILDSDDIIPLLTSNGANPNMIPGNNLDAVFTIALLNSKKNVIDVLINASANIHIKAEKFNESAHHCVVRNPNLNHQEKIDLMRHFVAQGLPIDTPNQFDNLCWDIFGRGVDEDPILLERIQCEFIPTYTSV